MAKEKRVVRPARTARTADDVQGMISRIGKAQAAVDRIEKNMKLRVESIKHKAELDAQPFINETLELFEEIFRYAEEHREELTQGGKRKTVETPAGIYGWRNPPPSIGRIGNKKKVLAAIKKAGLQEKFIRTEEDVNKEAMLADQETAKTIPGIKIEQFEFFFVKTQMSKRDLEKDIDTLRKSLE